MSDHLTWSETIDQINDNLKRYHFMQHCAATYCYLSFFESNYTRRTVCDIHRYKMAPFCSDTIIKSQTESTAVLIRSLQHLLWMNKVKIEVKKIIISEVLLAEVCYLKMKLVCEECKSKINAYKPSTYFHKNFKWVSGIR